MTLQTTSWSRETCKHDWAEISRTDATCKAPGSVTYTCSRCESTKTEPLQKLEHSWEVKQTAQTTYDENGNIFTQAFTIYRCSRCGEEYKDTDGTSPPGSSTPAPPGDNEDKTLWDKLGELLGSAFSGLLSLINAVLDKILGGLIDMVTGLLERLKELVDLFGSFGEALGILWTWLPPEVMAVLVTGLTTGSHTWAETSRTEPTDTEPGSIVYSCSNCDATKTETIPIPSITMPSLLRTLSEVFTAALSWVGTVSETIIQNPILLLCIVLSFISTGVVLFRRLLHINGQEGAVCL